MSQSTAVSPISSRPMVSGQPAYYSTNLQSISIASEGPLNLAASTSNHVHRSLVLESSSNNNNISPRVHVVQNIPQNAETKGAMNRDQPDQSTIKSLEGQAPIKSLCSIRILSAILCAAFIVSTAVCLLVTTFSFSMSAAQDIAERHAVAIATKAKTDVEELLNKPLASVSSWQFSYSRGYRPLPNETSVTNWHEDYWKQFTEAMKATDFRYQFAVFGFNDGNYAGCKNLPNEKFQCRLFKRPQNFTGQCYLLEDTYYRSNYTLVTTGNGTITYDPRTRGWYKMVPHQPLAMKWSSVYLSAMPTLPIIDVNAAMFNATGSLLGVISMTFELGLLSSFLADLVTTENTVSVLIDNEDLLLASSYSEPYLTSTNIPKPYTGEVPSNCLVSDSANDAALNIMLCRAPVASYSFAPLRQLARERPSLVKYGQSGALRLKLAEKDYFVSVVPVVTAQAAGMSWRFALFVPQNDIVGGIVRGRDVAIYIGIAIIVVAVALCFAVLTLLLSPLKDVTESMYRLATLQDTGSPSTPSRLHEIATIQGAFRVMSEELAKVKSFLPQSVLAQLYGAPSDDEDALVELSESTNNVRRTSRVASESSQSINTAPIPDQSTAATPSSKGTGTDRHRATVKPSLNTSLSLSVRKVSMLAINIAAYHSHVVGADPSAVVAASAEVVAAVVRAVNEHKGVLDGFQGDKFMASFNAVTAVGNHASAAASAALAASSAISSIVVSSRPDATPLSMTGGIASGPAMVGNMGTQAVKRFTVLGHVVTTAGILERLCKRYPGARTLLAGAAISETENFFDLLTCDVVTLPAAKGPQRSRIAQLIDTKNVGTDEWMYMLDAGTKASRYGLLNDAFAHFLNGDNHAARLNLEKARAFLTGPGTDTADSVVSVLDHLADLVGGTTPGGSYANPLEDFYHFLINPTSNNHTNVHSLVSALPLPSTIASKPLMG